MRKLMVFNNVSLDGYFCDQSGDMRWAHNDDAEWRAFTDENASGDGELLFGRVTYDMMVTFWPTPQAKQVMPVVAERMNSARKVVFSKQLREATWQNTRLLKGELTSEVRKLKEESGPTMVLMGSGSIVSQLATAGLVDEYQIVVHPLVLGRGRTLFETVEQPLNLKLEKTRRFQNGNIVLSYVRG